MVYFGRYLLGARWRWCPILWAVQPLAVCKEGIGPTRPCCIKGVSSQKPASSVVLATPQSQNSSVLQANFHSQKTIF